MPDEKRDTNNQKDSNIQFEEMLRAHCAEYHNHKETMAHAAILIQASLFAWVFQNKHDAGREVIVGYCIMWAIIFCYILWQLYHRNRAAKLVAEFISRHKDRINYDIKQEDKNITKYLKKCAKKGKWPTIKSDLCIYLGQVFLLIIICPGILTWIFRFFFNSLINCIRNS